MTRKQTKGRKLSIKERIKKQENYASDLESKGYQVQKPSEVKFDINQELFLSKAEVKLICRSCAKIHFIEEKPEDPTTVKDVVENWQTLGGFIINTKCQGCTSDRSLEININNLSASEFWKWVWVFVLIEKKEVTGE